MNKPETRKTGAAWPVYLLFLIYAVSTGLIGTLMSALLTEFGMEVSDGGRFTLAQYLGSGTAVLFSGMLLCRYQKWHIILLCYAVFALGMCLVGTVETLGLFLALLFVIGMATKLVDVTANAVISQIFTERKGLYMNLLHASFGIGNFHGPFLAERVLRAGLRWQLAYVLVGAAAILAGALLTMRILRKTLPATAPGQGERLRVRALLRKRTMWLLIFVLLFYCAHQIGTSSWLVMYLTDCCGASSGTASFSMSMFWLGLIGCRLGCSWLSLKVSSARLLLLGTVLGALALAAGLTIGSVAAVTVGSLLAGLFAGATIPLCMTLGYEAERTAQGTVSMLLFLSICAGQIIGPWLMGKLAVTGLRGAMWLDCGFLAAAAVMAALVAAQLRTAHTENA